MVNCTSRYFNFYYNTPCIGKYDINYNYMECRSLSSFSILFYNNVEELEVNWL